MLSTHCTTPGCPENGVSKEVPNDLAGARILCGECHQPTTDPVQIAPSELEKNP